MRLGTRDYTLGTTWSKSGSTVQTGKPRHPHIIGCRTLKNPDSHVRNLKHKSNQNAASGEVMGFTRYIKGEALTRQMPPRCLPVTLGTNARSRRQQTLRYLGDGLSIPYWRLSTPRPARSESPNRNTSSCRQVHISVLQILH